MMILRYLRTGQKEARDMRKCKENMIKRAKKIFIQANTLGFHLLKNDSLD